MQKSTSSSTIPLIDLSNPEAENALEIQRACIDHGFFCVKNHGVLLSLQEELDGMARSFFDLPLEEKLRIHMKHAGHAWRGFFSVGEELTSGKPDLKEGLYFGEHLTKEDQRVLSNWPLHGENLYPNLPQFKEAVEKYVREMTVLAHKLMRLVSLSLGLEADFIQRHYTEQPTVLFRIFHYPPTDTKSESWGVGEHTDYGLLTILQQDDCGGLEVKTKDGWVPVPPERDVFVCNIGDMLELLTKGKYVSTPHRVRNLSGRERLSFPFFFDPGFNALVEPLPMKGAEDLVEIKRWDDANLHRFKGTYRSYLLGKISKVFPDLASSELGKSKK